jgi:3-methylcrotonyl-CoA carboxylase alpha subunit
MFRSVLVANRGEIACRIIRTVRAMGMKAIAVYSDADKNAAHVRAADVAVHIGPAPPRGSYLDVSRIIEAARLTGAEAIHPGYGFLSENVALVTACGQQGLVFVGPPVAAMAAMGSKSAAKSAAAKVGVPVLPGYHGERQSLAELEEEAVKVGLPLMVKPSGGGGGKGMQVVSEARQLATALAGARRLAISSFGDPTLLLERYLPAPRHVEVQIVADTHGSIVALFDRDCSVQRRHQKLIEEAPAPGIDVDVRRKMYSAAIATARVVGYVNAGTVEFLYQDGEFWFMEMNARLQVEHPVTELVTGIDLVEWQLRVAAGEPLPLSQQEIVCKGHAIEARVCAEDPDSDFAPSAGQLRRCDWPRSATDVRVDAGFELGDTVPSDYDSLLGKVIAFDDSRPGAVDKLDNALRGTRVGGVTTNVAWLRQVLATDGFRDGQVTTGFLASYGERLSTRQPPTVGMKVLAALAVLHDGAYRPVVTAESPWATRDAFRPGQPAQQTFQFEFGAHASTVRIERGSEWRGSADGESCTVDWAMTGDSEARVIVDGLQQQFCWSRYGDQLQCWLEGDESRCRYADPRQISHRATAHEGELTSTLPGTVVMVAVKIGDAVEPGVVMMVIEAMKMEHSILAPYAGTVTKVHFTVGSPVQAGALLIDLQRIEQ